MSALEVGDEVELECTGFAHGGFAVGRVNEQVIFVRHALPDEQVRARITTVGKGGRWLHAEAVAVLRPSEHRVAPPCALAGPGGCGGCDLQHAELGYQRELKAQVIREQFQRLAGCTISPVVLPVPVAGAAADDGLHWRTRMTFATDAHGQAGLRGFRDSNVIPVGACPIADPRIAATGVLEREWERDAALVVAAGSRESVITHAHVTRSGRGGRGVRKRVGQEQILLESVPTAAGPMELEVAADGFWQAHSGAAQVYVEAVLAAIDATGGEQILDLYSGVGLFSVPLAQAVGELGEVLAIEGDERAAQLAARNLKDYPWARAERGDVAATLEQLRGQGQWDHIVLDPPRAGAGRAIIESLASLARHSITYVACDPAALARDTAYLGEWGWTVRSLTAFDAFPMTHHVETIATYAKIS